MPKTTPPLKEICASIKKLLKMYEPQFVAKNEFETRYELWTNKPVVIAGRKHDEIYFAGMIVQSSYVGFYYMPVYINTALKKEIGSDLLKALKGKSCFHIKTDDPNMMKQIKQALELGYKCYKKSGWL